ncbi:MAG: DUF4440 domain-containing protein [Gemmatimonadaceae bacterium]
MPVRAGWLIVFPVLLVAGCKSAQPGPAFAGAALLAPSSDAEAAHDELLRADLGRADSVARLGFAAGLASELASDVLYLRGGLPILRGRGPARAVIDAESMGPGTSVRWQPVRAEASSDNASGYTYGYAIYGTAQPGAPALRVDRYIAFWRKEQGRWRIAAYAETYGTPPSALALPPEASSGVVADAPMYKRRGALDDIRAADEDFSRAATKFGTGAAFGRYAAADGQIFSGPGEFITGPVAIAESFESGTTKGTLVWHPVEGEMSGSGDLGFTVGNAVFTGVREDGAALVRYSKYLTVWKRQRDGSWRYVVDGGSARPGT